MWRQAGTDIARVLKPIRTSINHPGRSVAGKKLRYATVRSGWLILAGNSLKIQTSTGIAQATRLGMRVKCLLMFTGLRASLDRLQLEYVDIVFANKSDISTPKEGKNPDGSVAAPTGRIFQVEGKKIEFFIYAILPTKS